MASPPIKSSWVTKGMNTASAEVVRLRSIWIRLRPSGSEDISPSSCWKSSRVRMQLWVWATLADWETAISSFCFVGARCSMRKVILNIRSLRLCKSCKRFFAAPP